MKGSKHCNVFVLYTVVLLPLFFRQSCSTASYKFVLLVEGSRSGGTLPKAFYCGLRAVEKLLQGQATINEAVISIGDDWWSEDENEQRKDLAAHETEAREKLCQQLSEPATAVLDLTTSGWPEGKKLTEGRGVPYLRIELLLASFLRATEAIIISKGASDAAYIFTSEQDLDDAISLMVGRSYIRILVLNRLGEKTIVKLKNMRPSPSYNAIFAGAMEIETLFQEASVGGLVSLDDRWILTVTDFRKSHVKSKGHQVMILSPAKDTCCAFSAGGMCMDICSCENDKEGGKDDIMMMMMMEKEKGMMDAEEAEESTCGPQMESMYIERIIHVLVEAKEAAGESTTAANPSTVTESRKNFSNDECGTFIPPVQPPKEFYSVVEQVTAASSSIGATLDSVDPWTSNDTTFTLYPRLSIDIEVIHGDKRSKLATWTSDNRMWGRSGITLETGSILQPQRPFLRVGIVEMIPWAYWEEGSVKGEGRWTGYCVDFMEALAERMEVDYELVAYREGDFGDRRPNGSWDGAIGALSRGETDLLVASTVMTSEREEVVDFVAPYFEQTGISIVIRKPVKKTSLFKFMTVLRLEVWLSIVGALSVTGVMIWFLDKYSPYSAQNNKKMYPYPCRKFTLKESFWFALTSFTPQGGGEAPKALSSRTLVAAYWLFVVLMLATFTANLAAFLTVERMQSPVQSLEQLARQSRINYTVVENSTTHQYFINMRNAEDTLYRVWKEITLNSTSNLSRYRVWDYPIKEQYGHILLAIEQTGPVASAAEGFQKVIDSESGEFAFIHDASQVKYETSRNCNLTEVGEPFAEQPFAIAVQTGSHLQEVLSRRILDLQKDRFFESLTGKYWNTSSKGQCPNSEDTEGITLESLGGVFIATLFGLALAMVTLAGEIMYYRRKRAKAAKEAEMLTKGIPIDVKKMGRIFKKDKFTFGKQRSRKIAAASLAASIMDRGLRINRKNLEDISHGQSFHVPRNIPVVSFQPVFREGDTLRQTRNNMATNRDLW